MTKKYLHVDIKRSADTTIVIEYDDRDWSWPRDAEAMSDFAIFRARGSHSRDRLFIDNSYDTGDARVSDSDEGYDHDVMPEPADRLWCRFRSAMSDHPQTLKDLVCPDGVNVHLQMTVDGRRMRSLDSIDLRDAEDMASSKYPGSELVASVCEQFLAVTGLVMGVIDIKALMARAFA